MAGTAGTQPVMCGHFSAVHQPWSGVTFSWHFSDGVVGDYLDFWCRERATSVCLVVCAGSSACARPGLRMLWCARSCLFRECEICCVFHGVVFLTFRARYAIKALSRVVCADIRAYDDATDAAGRFRPLESRSEPLGRPRRAAVKCAVAGPASPARLATAGAHGSGVRRKFGEDERPKVRSVPSDGSAARKRPSRARRARAATGSQRGQTEGTRRATAAA